MTDAISDYLDKRLSHLDRYIDRSDDSIIIDIEIGKTTNHHKSGDIFRAEATLHGKGLDIRVETEEADLYTAIDMMKDELVETVRAKKSKRLDFMRKSGQKLKNLLKGFRKGE
jgi:putative sigma-54 modulation protein